MWVKTQDNTLIADIDGMRLREDRGRYQLIGFCKNGQEIMLHSWEWPHFALDRIEAFSELAEKGSKEVFVLDLPENTPWKPGFPEEKPREAYYIPG